MKLKKLASIILSTSIAFSVVAFNFTGNSANAADGYNLLNSDNTDFENYDVFDTGTQEGKWFGFQMDDPVGYVSVDPMDANNKCLEILSGKNMSKLSYKLFSTTPTKLTAGVNYALSMDVMNPADMFTCRIEYRVVPEGSTTPVTRQRWLTISSEWTDAASACHPLADWWTYENVFNINETPQTLGGSAITLDFYCHNNLGSGSMYVDNIKLVNLDDPDEPSLTTAPAPSDGGDGDGSATATQAPTAAVTQAPTAAVTQAPTAAASEVPTTTATTEPGDTVTKPKSVKLNKKKVTLKVKKSVKLKATLTPKKISAGWTKLTWKSSKTKVAKVNQKGKVTAVKKGTAKITVTTKNKKSAKCTVKVK